MLQEFEKKKTDEPLTEEQFGFRRWIRDVIWVLKKFLKDTRNSYGSVSLIGKKHTMRLLLNL